MAPLSKRPGGMPLAMWFALVAFMASAALADRAGFFESSRAWSSSRSAPADAFGSGGMARVLRSLDKIHPLPYEVSAGGFPEVPNDAPTRSPERSVRRYSLDAMTPDQMPSTTILRRLLSPDEMADRRVAFLSLTLPEVEARDLLANPTERGIRWERPGYVSYFVDGRLAFASGVGIRIHGGRSRIGSEHKSFRLYFRAIYGADRFPPGRLFDGGDEMLRDLVVHNDIRHDVHQRPWHFVNPLAYSISSRIGCLTPRTQPARFYLNGEFQGVYVLTERLGLDYLTSRFGHDDFHVARTRRDPHSGWFEAGDPEAFAALNRWSRGGKGLAMRRAATRIDLENLTNWFISVLFNATTDWPQGLLVKDQRDPEARWFWVNWDMDHSFMNARTSGREPPWDEDLFARVLYRSDHLRSVLLTRLLEGSQYRDFLVDRIVDVLNHELTPQFLADQLAHYRELAISHGIEQLEFLESIEQFFEHRPAVLRRQLNTHLGVGEGSAISVTSSDGSALRVDGYVTASGYDGWYFKGMNVRVRIPAARQGRFSHWTVDGVRVEGSEFQIHHFVDGPASIAAVFVPEDSPRNRR